MKKTKIFLVFPLVFMIFINIFLISYKNYNIGLKDINGDRKYMDDVNIIGYDSGDFYDFKYININSKKSNVKDISSDEYNYGVNGLIGEFDDFENNKKIAVKHMKNSLSYLNSCYKNKDVLGMAGISLNYEEGIKFIIHEENLSNGNIKSYEIDIDKKDLNKISNVTSLVSTIYDNKLYILISNIIENDNIVDVFKINLENESYENILSRKLDKNEIDSVENLSFNDNQSMNLIVRNLDNTLGILKYDLNKNDISKINIDYNINDTTVMDLEKSKSNDTIEIILQKNISTYSSQKCNLLNLIIDIKNGKILENKNYQTFVNGYMSKLYTIDDKIYVLSIEDYLDYCGNFDVKQYISVFDKNNEKLLYTGEIKTDNFNSDLNIKKATQPFLY